MNISICIEWPFVNKKNSRVGAIPPRIENASRDSVRNYRTKKFRENIFLDLEKSPPLWVACGDFQKASAQTLVAVGLRKKRKSSTGLLQEGCKVPKFLVPTLRRGNAIPRRSSVAEVLTTIKTYTCASDAGASFQVRSHAGAWERGLCRPPGDYRWVS
jgi:hypothetical protein